MHPREKAREEHAGQHSPSEAVCTWQSLHSLFSALRMRLQNRGKDLLSLQH